MIPPRLGDHHHDDLRQLATGHHQQLHGVIEFTGVTTAGFDDWHHIFYVGTQNVTVHQPLPRCDPVSVSAQGIDLSVVGHPTQWLGARPVR